ncbi:uncharacterized protein LOC135473954 [Liolophura sinensis]|uniref:uncharacterized protein LOC135473954 n=1 Tax=Liolophura sinensis TaxID=3198878 RepID=UPI003158C951
MFSCAPPYVNNSVYAKPECTPFNTSTDMDTIRSIQDLQYVSMAFSAVIAVVSAVGNSVMICAIVRRKLLGRSTCIFVFSISMADAVAGGVGLPGDILVLFSVSQLASYLCKLHLYVSCFAKTAVFYTLCAMVSVRAYSTFSGGKRTVTAGRCMFFISLIWFFSTAYNIWSVVIYDSYSISVTSWDRDLTFTEKTSICLNTYRFKYLANIFTYLDLTVIYAVPILFVSILIASSMHKYNAQSSSLFHFPGNFSRFRLPMLLSIVFVLCQAPWEIVHFLVVEVHRISWTSIFLLRFVTLLSYSRGCLNLVVYLCFRQYVYRKRRQSQRLKSTKQTLALPPIVSHRRVVQRFNSRV